MATKTRPYRHMWVLMVTVMGMRLIRLCVSTPLRTVWRSDWRGGDLAMATAQNPTNQEIVKMLQDILQELSDLRGEIAKLAKPA